MTFLNLNKNINFEDSYNIFCQIADAKLTDEQIKDILLTINEIGINENLLLGAVKSFSQRAKKINIKGDIFDVCGTGGDGLNTLNISTAVTFVLSSLGFKIAKHGNRSVSSKSGSADIFDKMQINMSDDEGEIKNSIEKYNLAFIFAPFFHPSFKNVAKVRSKLKVKTIFNYLGPLLNPANPNYQLIGCSNEKISYIMAKICQKLSKKRVFIVHSFDGMDEISISDKTILLDVNNQQIEKKIISPIDLNLEIVAIEKIKGGDPEYNFQRMLELFSGKKDAYFDIVAINAAYAALLSGKYQDIFDSMKNVTYSLEQKLPLKLLNKIQNGQ